MIKLLNNMVAFKRESNQKQTKGGIFIPQSDGKFIKGEVTHVADNITKFKTIKVGDRILVPLSACSTAEVGEETLFLITFDNIIGILK